MQLKFQRKSNVDAILGIWGNVILGILDLKIIRDDVYISVGLEDDWSNLLDILVIETSSYWNAKFDLDVSCRVHQDGLFGHLMYLPRGLKIQAWNKRKWGRSGRTGRRTGWRTAVLQGQKVCFSCGWREKRGRKGIVFGYTKLWFGYRVHHQIKA